jgi:microcystin-dependent protein
MAIQLHNGVVADNPTALTDRIRVSVPDLTSADRKTFGPFAFDPIVSGGGGTRLPQRGDKAVIGIDDGTGEQWVVRWHRDDTSVPPYDEEGGSVAWPVGGDPGEVLGFVGPDPDDVAWVLGTPGPQGIQGPVGPIGPQGVQGPTGAKGDTGAQGAQGIQGPQGVKGDTGAQGPQGIQGVKGDKGDTGAQGPVGTVYDSDQIATIKTFAGTTIPTNWMLADGRLLVRADYSQLADALGVPAGQASFNIPDLTNRFIYGATNPAAQGAKAGTTAETLTAAQMPSHNHNHPSYPGLTGASDRVLNHDHSLTSAMIRDQGGGSGGVTQYAMTMWAWPNPVARTIFDAAPDHLHNIDPAGGDASHNNMPPYIVLAYIIKVKGAQIDSAGALVGPMGPAGLNGQQAIYTSTPADGATSIAFAGLDGNTDFGYEVMLSGVIIAGTTVVVRLNGDTANNYSCYSMAQYFQPIGSDYGPTPREGTKNGLNIGVTDWGADGQIVSRALISTKRRATFTRLPYVAEHSFNAVGQDYNLRANWNGHWYNPAIDNVTSITIVAVGGAFYSTRAILRPLR